LSDLNDLSFFSRSICGVPFLVHARVDKLPKKLSPILTKRSINAKFVAFVSDYLKPRFLDKNRATFDARLSQVSAFFLRGSVIPFPIGFCYRQVAILLGITIIISPPYH
jgi:hypothetical protein